MGERCMESVCVCVHYQNSMYIINYTVPGMVNNESFSLLRTTSNIK